MKKLLRAAAVLAALPLPLAALLGVGPAHAQSDRALAVRNAEVVRYWTPERRATAIPRDLVIDPRGLGYLRTPAGGLEPYGHDIAAQAGPPGGSGDSSPPGISSMSPGPGDTIGASATFSAVVTDASGVKSVTFYVRKGSGVAQSFTARSAGGGVYTVSLSGFTDGAWSWYVVAKDGAKPSNTATSPVVEFTVSTGGGGGGGGGGGDGSVSNQPWSGGTVQEAAGRIYFEMPSNNQRKRWAGYVCSGTVTSDGTTGRSIIITAAHCVYDDSHKAFARNVLFIPDQAETTGSGTDLNCANDPIGCWTPAIGVVDVNWTTRTFPDNVAWDYAFYVVSDSGAHAPGLVATSEALDAAALTMDVSFAAPSVGALTYALGYSYNVDPQFMYCSDPVENLDASNWWLPNCGLSGGSSGGPWSQPFNVSTGNGPIISVNSWGYTNSPGMAGPKLSGTSAACVFATAKSASIAGTFADGDAGVAIGCP